MLHTQRLLIYSAPLKVVAIHRPILLLASPPPMLLHTQEPAKAPAEYMRQRPTREIRDDDPISKGNTPSRKKKSQIRWKATPFPVCIYSSMLPLLLLSLSLSLCVYSVCVCVHLMKDGARSSREPGGFIQYDGAAYRSYSRQSIQRQASVMMSPSRS